MSKLTPTDYIEIKQLLEALHSYSDIGKMYNVSRERIRQIARSYNLQRLRIQHNKNLQIEKDFSILQRKDPFHKKCKEKYRNKKQQVIHNSVHEWTIPFEEIVWNTHCPILGIELDYYSETRVENSPSFDRIDNTKGYVSGNVCIVSWRANRLKNDGSLDEHRKIVQYMSSLSHNH